MNQQVAQIRLNLPFTCTFFMTGGEIQGEREYGDHGSSYLLLVELGTPVKAWSLRPFGQSEDINSPHYADMTALYSKTIQTVLLYRNRYTTKP